MNQKQNWSEIDQSRTKNTTYIDGLINKIQKPKVLDFSYFSQVKESKNKSVLFFSKGRTGCFFTSDSKLYITPEEYAGFRNGQKIIRLDKRVDSLNARSFERTRIYSIKEKDILYLQIRKRYSSLKNYIYDFVQGSVQGVSMTKVWNVSIVGAVIFGMLTMTMIYRYLGESVSAEVQKTELNSAKEQMTYEKENKKIDDEIDTEFITKLLRDYADFESKEKGQKELEKEIKEMVKGYPIEKMVPEIAKKDRIVAALLVAIAKKESGWGKHVPVLNGQDCYNYWGYRGKRDRMGSGGHTCFDSPEDAVNTVAKRIEFLVSNEKLNTPAKMVVWKCGYDCSWDNPKAVQKWIDDVDYYFQKLNK